VTEEELKRNSTLLVKYLDQFLVTFGKSSSFCPVLVVNIFYCSIFSFIREVFTMMDSIEKGKFTPEPKQVSPESSFSHIESIHLCSGSCSSGSYVLR
jgi:hypothetical protein